MAYNKYVLMREAAELAVSKNGVVFGGYVRDSILRNAAQKKFEGNPSQYEDVTVSPETLDRLLVPRDIDIHFATQDDYREFVRAMIDRSYVVKTKTRMGGYDGKVEDFVVHSLFVSLEMKLSLGSSFGAARTMLMNNFRPINKLIPGGQFRIDAVVCPTERFQELSLDYECNGLVMTQDGIKLGHALSVYLSCMEKFEKFQEVLGDILQKKARTVNVIENRWKKMIERNGWEIIGHDIDKVAATGIDDQCIICQSGGSHFKLKCCSALYHKECLKKTLDRFKENCVHCRVPLCFYGGEEEVRRLLT